MRAEIVTCKSNPGSFGIALFWLVKKIHANLSTNQMQN